MPKRNPPITDLEERIGYTFEDRDLLRQALTHCSYANEAPDDVEDNEPLEFLGDAILSFVVSDELCRRYPDFREGRLSRAKASLVQTSTLSTVAQDLDLGSHLRLGRGEEKSGGAQKDSLLANAFEAVVAAIYRDGGVRAVRSFIKRALRDRLRRAGNPERIVDAKSALQERLQGRGLGIPWYEVVEERGPDHHKTFVVEILLDGRSLGRGEGRSKKVAQQRAAREALALLEAEKKKRRSRKDRRSAGSAGGPKAASPGGEAGVEGEA